MNARPTTPDLWRWLAISFLVAAIVFPLLLMAAPALACSVCGEPISGRYIKAGNGSVFCSRECLQKTLPRCAVCGRVIEGTHLVHETHHYCSESCFEAILPRCEICGTPSRKSIVIDGHSFCQLHGEGPRCLHCGLPFGSGATLPDGRQVCGACKPGLVFLQAEADALYADACDAVRRITGLPLDSPPPMALAGTDQLPEHEGLNNTVSIQEHGRYKRFLETTQQRYAFGMIHRERTEARATILILYGLSAPAMSATAAHELGHHLIAEIFPRAAEQAPAWLIEGICQYLAAQLCLQKGYSNALQRIEEAPDPIYGEGYRFLKKRFGHGNWRSLAGWLQTVDFARLPQTLAGLTQHGLAAE